MDDLELYLKEYRLSGEDVVRVRTGRPVCSSPGRKSYAQVSLKVNGKLRVFRVHRIKFALRHGYLPPRVDHRNRDERDDDLSNLRPATASLNAANAKRQGRELPLGVSRKGRKFRAYYTEGGKQRTLGTYENVEDAGAAAQAARKALYGEFYNGSP